MKKAILGLALISSMAMPNLYASGKKGKNLNNASYSFLSEARKLRSSGAEDADEKALEFLVKKRQELRKDSNAARSSILMLDSYRRTIETDVKSSGRTLRSSTNVGGGVGQTDNELIWCHNLVGYLKRYKSKALSRHTERKQLKHLVIGLEKTLSNVGEEPLRHLYTYETIQRGLEIFYNIDVLNPAVNDKHASIYVDMIVSFYDMIINEISPNLDQYVYSYDRVDFDIMTLEDNTVSYIRRLFDWANMNLTYDLETSKGLERAPKGKADAYLLSIQFLAKYAAADLKETFWECQFSSTIIELEEMSIDLEEYLNTDRDSDDALYLDDRDATHNVFLDIERIMNEISGSYCN